MPPWPARRMPVAAHASSIRKSAQGYQQLLKVVPGDNEKVGATSRKTAMTRTEPGTRKLAASADERESGSVVLSCGTFPQTNIPSLLVLASAPEQQKRPRTSIVC